MSHPIGRRKFLTHSGAAVISGALAGCRAGWLATAPRSAPPSLQLMPLRATPDRITAITVCTRPFRAQGPRLDVEQLFGKTVVHNYGHGGSGWSLSWGSSALAVEKALATGERQIAVIGCGALGMTSALLLQRAGVRVTIYAKELPPNVRSSLATGLWSPDSRICFEQHATPSFRRTWESMARRSFATYQTLLGLPGAPVEFIDEYFVSDAPNMPPRDAPAGDPRPRFAELQRELLPDLLPQTELFAPGTHPLGMRYLHRSALMMFNLSAYARLLLADFHSSGGQIQIDEFHSPSEFVRVREKTLINATGYGARALFNDQAVIPVRGQLARMIPEPQINYGLIYQGVAFVPRRDGLVFQMIGENDYYGFNDDTMVPDRAEAEHAVNTIAELFR
ncbi:MAG TPA: FAD-dependent oxidoreductase [Steroidobacteraceae bacterium]|nr:FAD-dependent oxidoreductase [Steroidobacteraceae bacterium]